MDTIELYDRGLRAFERLVTGLGDGDWARRTPCTQWTVRDLVNHIVYEDRWAVPLLAGSTIEDVGTRFDGDLLGDDPVDVMARAAAEVREVLGEDGVTGRKVSLSYGEEIADEYLRQLAADHHIHAWDLAAAIGADDALDPVVIDEVSTWFDTEKEAMFREGGAIGPALHSPDGDPKATLLARLGRVPDWTPQVGIVHRFAEALDQRDLDAAMAMLSQDAVFESTEPAPDGARIEGRVAITAYFEQMMANTTEPSFLIEEMLPAGEDVVLRSVYSWDDPDGSRGHVRGLELLRVRGGAITEMLAYVKG